MKMIIAAAIALGSFQVMAKDVALKLDISRHLKNINSAKAELVYVSTTKGSGCQTYSGDILDPVRQVYIEKKIELEDGIAELYVPREIERCKAKLITVSLKLRMDRKAVAQEMNAKKSDVDRNRIDFHFNLVESSSQNFSRPELKISKLYVAGSDELKYTFSAGFEIAPVINDAIDLTL